MYNVHNKIINCIVEIKSDNRPRPKVGAWSPTQHLETTASLLTYIFLPRPSSHVYGNKWSANRYYHKKS